MLIVYYYFGFEEIISFHYGYCIRAVHYFPMWITIPACFISFEFHLYRHFFLHFCNVSVGNKHFGMNAAGYISSCYGGCGLDIFRIRNKECRQY